MQALPLLSLTSMKNILMYLFISLANSFIISPYLLLAQPPPSSASRITMLGSLYCDVCYDSTFSKHSYFLPGVDVHVQCKFKAISPRTTEQISFSVNRTTDKYGTYKVDIPSVDGVDCTEDPSVQSFCQASLITSSVSDPCNVPSTRSTSTEITVKSKQDNACTYTLGALSYKPPRRNFTICRNARLESENSWNPSKNFLPYIPPYVLRQPPPLPLFPPLMPQYPRLPRLSPLPPFPSFPFPPLKPDPPSLPYPFPQPAFNLGDPTTWIPNYPLLSLPRRRYHHHYSVSGIQ